MSMLDRGGRYRTAFTATSVIVAIVVLVVAAAAVTFMIRGGGGGQAEVVEMHEVHRGDFEITIPCSGELTALNQVEIRNKLENRAVITEIVNEGDMASSGDILVRFNDEEIVNAIKDAEDAVSTATNDLTAAEVSHEIKVEERESEIDKAKLKVTLAELAFNAWNEGESVQKKNELKIAVDTSQKEYDRLHDRFEQSKMLYEEKFLSLDELKQDEISVIRAEAERVKAETQRDVYETYTYFQEQAQKQSDLDQAKAEEGRVLQRYDAEVRQAESAVASRRHRLNSTTERLAKLQRQLESCTVTAPSDGLVVYASSLESSRWGGSDDPPQVGTEVQRNRLVMVLPDTSEMVAEVKVNEALSGLIEAGQKVTVISDAVPDTTYSGEVLSVGVMAVSGGWVDRNRRDYTVRVKIETPEGHELKPAMRCKAELFVDRLEDVVHVPSQAIFWTKGQSYVYVPQEGGFAQRKVSVGRSSELYTEVIDGLTAGESVLLREPRPERVVARLEIEDRSRAGKEGPGGPPKGRTARREGAQRKGGGKRRGGAES